MINCSQTPCSLDTPHKKVKPNQEALPELSTEHSIPKGSLLSRLRQGVLKFRRPTSFAPVSEFTIVQEKRELMEQEKPKIIEEEMDLQEPALKIGLNRKFTCYHKEEQQEDYLPQSITLYRNNSTCDQARQIEDIKLGDNIYLKRLTSKGVNQHRIDRNRKDSGLRLDQDYEIEQNLGLHSGHHTSYICLNKLQRIFYYVKKVKMSWEKHENYSFLQQLVSNQVRIYNADPQSHFLRFYQTWLESHALYLTFEVAVESLGDATFSHNRLRQIQVWDLLRDCCSALKWLSEEQNQAHLNIKPGNIVKCQRKFKLVDPYCNKAVLQLYLEKEGDNWSGWQYLAPQIKKYSYLLEGLDLGQADIYSLGMCLIENLLGEKYFPKEGKQLRAYLQKHLHGYSPALVRVLLGMASTDPRVRPRAEELCQMEGLQQQKRPKPRRFSI